MKYRPVFFLMGALLSTPVLSDECMRLVPARPSVPTGTDGPGAFGPLHGLVSLGCLRFNAIEMKGSRIVAIVMDERRKMYRVGVGDWIGENGGRISEITKERITILQVVKGADGAYMEVQRYLFKSE